MRLRQAYGFDVILQCRDCQDTLGRGKDGSFSYADDRHRLRLEAGRHIRRTGHTVEMITSTVWAYGPDR